MNGSSIVNLVLLGMVVFGNVETAMADVVGCPDNTGPAGCGFLYSGGSFTTIDSPGPPVPPPTGSTIAARA
jgi:hypothetical protein